MGEDILGDWKKNRYILIPSDLSESDHHLIILTDASYWAEHVHELVEWCDNTEGVRTQGMTVEIDNDKTLTLFMLRWSS
jgi:hypothetical protein